MPDGAPIQDVKGLENQPIRLAVEIFLQKDTNDCWNTVVYFSNPDKIVGGETIEVDNTPPIQKIFGCANSYAKDIKGKEGERIRAMLAIIDRLYHEKGELAALNVWYYARHRSIRRGGPSTRTGPR